MSRIYSRTDLHYVIAFMAGIIVTFVGSAAVNQLVALVPLSNSSSLTDLQALTGNLSAVSMAGILLVYGAGFLGLSVILRRIGALPRSAGLKAGVATAVILLAALMLTAVNTATISGQSFGESSVWMDFLSISACGVFYMFAWFLAITYGKRPAGKSSTKKRML